MTTKAAKLTKPQITILRVVAGEIDIHTRPRQRLGTAVTSVVNKGLIHQVHNPGQPDWAWHYELTEEGRAALNSIKAVK